MPCSFTREAARDLIGIYLYGFENFGEEQAEHYFSGLTDCFDLLTRHPHSCRERTEFNPPVRIHHYNRHLIIYTSGEAGVLIVRVLHDSMDVPRHLLKE